ncbi:hypothetical protein WJX84_004640, partial [Apatococcus fuscideae]
MGRKIILIEKEFVRGVSATSCPYDCRQHVVCGTCVHCSHTFRAILSML